MNYTIEDLEAELIKLKAALVEAKVANHEVSDTLKRFVVGLNNELKEMK